MRPFEIGVIGVTVRLAVAGGDAIIDPRAEPAQRG